MPNVVAQFLSVSVIAALAIAAAPASGATAQRTFVASTGLKATAIGNSSLLVSGTVIRDNSGDGISLAGAPLLVTLERVEIKTNNGNGVNAKDGPTVAMRDSSIGRNHLSGVSASTTLPTSTRVMVHGSQIHHNGSAGVGGNVTDPGGYVIVTVSDSNVSDNQSAGISMTGVAGHAFLLARGNTIDNKFGGIYSDVLGGGAVATIKDNVIHDGLDGVTIGHGGVATIANNAVSLVSTGVNVAAGGATVRSATNNLFSDTGEDVHGGTLTSILPK